MTAYVDIRGDTIRIYRANLLGEGNIQNSGKQEY